MGSFANSLLVKHDDARVVAAAVDEFLTAAGYKRTKQRLSRRDVWDELTPKVRAIYVCDGGPGWVGLLDSAWSNFEGLAAELSRHFPAALSFMVDDSDAWYYLLFVAGQQVDFFASNGDHLREEAAEAGRAAEGQTDRAAPDVRSAGGDHGTRDLTKNLTPEQLEHGAQVAANIAALQQRMIDESPPEIRAIWDRLSAGKCTPEEMQTLMAWRMTHYYDEIHAALTGQAPPPGAAAEYINRAQAMSAQPEPIPESRLREHYEALSPVLPVRTSPDAVLKILSDRQTSAELTLGQFMALLGISPYLATTSYRYLIDADSEEAEDIPVLEELRYRCPRIP